MDKLHKKLSVLNRTKKEIRPEDLEGKYRKAYIRLKNEIVGIARTVITDTVCDSHGFNSLPDADTVAELQHIISSRTSAILHSLIDDGSEENFTRHLTEFNRELDTWFLEHDGWNSNCPD